MQGMATDLEEPWQNFLVRLQEWEASITVDCFRASTDWAIEYSCRSAKPYRSTSSNRRILSHRVMAMNKGLQADFILIR